jgi:uncharacterized protein
MTIWSFAGSSEGQVVCRPERDSLGPVTFPWLSVMQGLLVLFDVPERFSLLRSQIMKKMLLCAVGFSMCLLLSGLLVQSVSAAEKLKVAVVTGGHGYEEKPFEEMFKSFADFDCRQVVFKQSSDLFDNITAWPYGVVVFYNMSSPMTEQERANFLTLLDKGVGLVILHHAIVGYSDWPEFRKIVGARYFLNDVEENGVKYPRSQYEHGVDYNVHVVDSSHPVTSGVSDFTIKDETYKGYTLEADNHILLTTENPKCQKEIGWTRTYRNAKVCYLQMGHGADAYTNPGYKHLVKQAIHWVSGK